MAIAKTFLSVELADGTEHENIRVIIQDQLAWGKAAKANGWPTDDFQAPVFLAWKALKRNELYTGDYETFRDQDAVDVAQSDEAGPTQES